MGAPTDIALKLARDIAAEYADESDSDIRSWARWQILGAWRLAMRLDHEAAGPALAEFLDIAGWPKKPTPALADGIDSVLSGLLRAAQDDGHE